MAFLESGFQYFAEKARLGLDSIPPTLSAIYYATHSVEMMQYLSKIVPKLAVCRGAVGSRMVGWWQMDLLLILPPMFLTRHLGRDGTVFMRYLGRDGTVFTRCKIRCKILKKTATSFVAAESPQETCSVLAEIPHKNCSVLDELPYKKLFRPTVPDYKVWRFFYFFMNILGLHVFCNFHNIHCWNPWKKLNLKIVCLFVYHQSNT